MKIYVPHREGKDHLVHQDPKDPLDHLDQRDQMAPRDLQDLKDQMDLRDHLDLKESKAQMILWNLLSQKKRTRRTRIETSWSWTC